MKKFRMTDSDACPRCGNTENLRHLIWECAHSINIWKLYNEIINEACPNSKDSVETYESIFDSTEMPCINIIKLKVIQELIQIDRPKNWNKSKLIQVIKELISMEKYNAIKLKLVTKFYSKWEKFEYLKFEL
jgi:hypothetical protein